MRQSIETTYLGPTTHLGARIRAKSQAGSLLVHYDYALSAEQNHAEAARQLAARYEWDGPWYAGGLVRCTGFVFVNVNPSSVPEFVMPGFVTPSPGQP